jgi:thioredoxin 1
MKTLLCWVWLLTLALGAPAWAGEADAPGQPLPVAGTVTLVDLGAASCKPCKMMAPLLEELKEEYRGRAAVVFVDVRQDRPAIERFGLRAIPTQIFFDRAGNEVYRHLGFLDKETMTLMLNKLLEAR